MKGTPKAEPGMKTELVKITLPRLGTKVEPFHTKLVMVLVKRLDA